jgi:4-hydroxy-3-polyprenylbenzoate decarboxylase
MIVICDTEIPTSDLFITTWHVCNNIDPKRDCRIFKNAENSTIIIDGTSKSELFDNFKRDWPNIVVSDKATIAKIDTIWNQLGLGELIESPSLKFEKMVKNNDAVRSF